MDNVTHTLAGLVTAELVVQLRQRSSASPAAPAWARAAWVASALAHNLPDADLAWSALTPGRIGYLLHHRGHTHTLALAPLVALVAFALALGWTGSTRAGWSRADYTWLAALCALGPLGHLSLDYSNEYGVHPFWPAWNGWVYGDAVFILEPLFWASTIPALVLAMRSRGARLVWTVLLAAVLAVGPLARLVAWPLALGALAWAALVFALARAAGPRGRPLVALGASLAVLLAFVLGSRAADRTARDALARAYPGWTTLDASRSPLPANPACWQLVAVQRGPADRYALRTMRVSAWPAIVPARACTARLRTGTTAPLARGALRTDAAVSEGDYEASAAALRAWAGRCDVAAYLRFARTPFVLSEPRGLVLGDLRYDREAALGFAEMVAPAQAPQGCPPRVPPWSPPRADLLAPP